jgi:hypothetical protein
VGVSGGAGGADAGGLAPHRSVLQVRYEQHAEMLLGFLHLACALICLKALNQIKV